MFKKASLMTGGMELTPNKRYPQRTRQHGPIRISMIAGERIDPPIEIAGDFSSRMECDFCHDYFPAKPSTPAVVLLPGYIFERYMNQLMEPAREWRAFCCEDHCTAWMQAAEHQQHRLREPKKGEA